MTPTRRPVDRVVDDRPGDVSIRDFLTWVTHGGVAVDMTRTRSLDLWLYVETAKLHDTTAPVWCYVLDDTGVHVTIPTAVLRAAVDDPSSKPVERITVTGATRGVLVDFVVLLYRLKQTHAKGTL